MATIEGMAEEFASFLTTQQRGDKTIAVRTDDAPEWVGDIIHDIHGNMFPDDWTYATISECADYIAANGDDGEQPETDFRTGALLEWLRDYPNAVDACDEAAEEYGASKGIIETIQMGQHCAVREIHYALLRALQERVDECGEDEAEDDDAE